MFSDSYLRDWKQLNLPAVARSVKILNLLVVLFSPLLSIVEDQVNYLRSPEIEAAFIEILYGKLGGGGGGGGGCFTAWKPGVIDWR